MDKTKYKIQKLNVSTIRDNDLLSISIENKDIDRCEKTIREYGGLLTPLVVRALDNGSHMLVSGECELLALQNVGMSTIEAIIVDCENDAEANKLSLLLISLRQSPNPLSEGLILQELLKDGKVNQFQAASLVGKSISWVSKRISLVTRLNKSVVMMVAEKRICSHTAQEIAKLPGEFQQAFAVKVIMDSLPKSAVEKLIAAYNTENISSSLKESILKYPKEALIRVTESFKESEKVRKNRVDTPSVDSRLYSGLQLIAKLTSEVECILVKLDEDQLTKAIPSLVKTVEFIQRLVRIIQVYNNEVGEKYISPGKTKENEGGNEIGNKHRFVQENTSAISG